MGYAVMKIQKIAQYLTNANYRFSVNDAHGLYKNMKDETYIKTKYYVRNGKRLDLVNPKTYTEKIQWLKLYDHRPIYTQLVDKIESKKVVAKMIGNCHIIPTLGTWNSFDDIDFESLPNQFVLKCSHDSGGIIICSDKKSFDIEKARKKINRSLCHNYYLQGREWPYKDVPHRILAEKYIVDNRVKEYDPNNAANGLIDFKFYCFNGEPRFLYVGFANIQNGEKHDQLSFFDFDWKPTPFYRIDHEPLPFIIDRPDNLDEMIEIARQLSSKIPFVRVDLYNIDGQILFSEMTFAPGSGFCPFCPEEWERKIGDWIVLPIDK